MLTIDASVGEGGGQIVRTAIGLSLVTGKPVRLDHIRARRQKPGLLHQHLTAVAAAAQMSGAKVEGARLGSRQLEFAPGQVRPGNYRFDVGTAGSTTLVLQTILPALLTADGPSQLELLGGTHNPLAPPFEFLEQTYLPLVNRMGPRVAAHLDAAGFYPAGGGQIRVDIQPCARLSSIELLNRGAIRRQQAKALVSRLPLSIADRELATIRDTLNWSAACGSAMEVASRGPGNVVLIEIESEHITETFAGFGAKGVRAETVASRAADEASRYLHAAVPVGEHLADQLVLLLALAGGGAFRTTRPSLHTTTNVQIIERFLEVEISSTHVQDDVREIRVARI